MTSVSSPRRTTKRRRTSRRSRNSGLSLARSRSGGGSVTLKSSKRNGTGKVFEKFMIEEGCRSQEDNQDDSSNLFRIIVSSDIQLGYNEKDPERGVDSFSCFDEQLGVGVKEDMVLLGGSSTRTCLADSWRSSVCRS